MTQIEPTVPVTKVQASQYKNFSCGVLELDQYLKMYAKQNEKKRVGRTFVLLNDSNAVIGYYTLSTAQISFEELPSGHSKGMPHYPIPAARLCRLAVDSSCKGQGIGQHLLMEAIDRVLNASSEMAAYALVVDAKKDSKAFYLKYGFIPLNGQDLKLFLPLNTLENI